MTAMRGRVTGMMGDTMLGNDKVLSSKQASPFLKYRKHSRCRWCDSDLPEEIDAYPHDDGWWVEGESTKMWLSIHCQKCGYDWSLWKLGVSREFDGRANK
jgi:hypothetical protein